jgi:predicted RNase H-like nuclease
MTVVGVDACKGGWIAVVKRDENITAHVIEYISFLNALVPDARVIAIDIPIGLLSEGVRTADIEGRKALEHRQSTLFVVPVRQALMAATPDEATRISKNSGGPGISRQSFGLKEKILQVDSWLAIAPCPVYEVHPELSFKEMTGTVLTSSKKTWSGMRARREALLREGISLDEVAVEAGSKCATDDMLDAGAAVWSAERILDGRARSIPLVPQRSPEGRDIAIWF